MEFVGFGEVWQELKARGVVVAHRDDHTLELSIDAARRPVVVELRPPTLSGSLRADADVAIECPEDRLAATLETALHKLHLAPLYVMPVCTWRCILDLACFGLATNEAWAEIDAQASVEQNTRDPLVCEPSDLHTLRALVRLLLSEGQPDPTYALTIIGTGQSLVARVEPKSPVRIAVASATVAEQLRDAAVHFLNGTVPHA